MFKKFVFIPPLILALIFAAAMAYATYEAVVADMTLEETSAKVTGSWTYVPDPEANISEDFPVLEGSHDATPFTCRCEARQCTHSEDLGDGEILTVLIDPENTGTCYEANTPSRPDRWGMPLGMLGLMLLLAMGCFKALTRQGERTH